MSGIYPPVENINKPPATYPLPNFGEIWRHRALLIQMIIRELKARYKQSVLGISWAIFNPIITMVVMSFVFHRLAEVPSYDIPYAVFSFTGIVPWQLFSKGLSAASQSIVAYGPMINKVYFPRLIPPIARLFTGVIDFGLAFIVLLILMLVYGFLPSFQALLWVPFFTLLALAAALGLGLWLSALHVRFRDIGLLVPFLVQMLFYLTPVAYPSDLLEQPWRTLYGINPMVTVCDGFRWTLLGIDTFDPSTALASVISALVLLVSGLLFFRSMESSFPDLV